ncbi:hypothetical protein C8R46DRAFT_1344762 [Mycena filopes]|nr:hypothetical protein C8R46DRAFT_1344762 [Mycena filopes]
MLETETAQAVVVFLVGISIVLACVALCHLKVSNPLPPPRPPLLGPPLAVNNTRLFQERFSRLPPPTPAEVACVDIQSYASLRTPPKGSTVSNRRHFTAPASPNQYLLERQRAHLRLPHKPPSLPTTPALPFPVTPPRSPALDLRQVAIHQNRIARLDGPCVDYPPRSPPSCTGSLAFKAYRSNCDISPTANYHVWLCINSPSNPFALFTLFIASQSADSTQVNIILHKSSRTMLAINLDS